MKKVLIILVRFYQLAFASYVGDVCRFHPSCSEYAIDAIQKKSFFKALFLIIKRLLRCHPFSKGGIDEVPS
jgi:hypothetical protein